jgi:hypothetical protein
MEFGGESVSYSPSFGDGDHESRDMAGLCEEAGSCGYLEPVDGDAGSR